MELNVWTSTTVQNIDRDDSKDEFVVTLIKADGSKRIMRPKHIVMAIGFAGNEPKIPDIPGMVRCAVLRLNLPFSKINKRHSACVSREGRAFREPQASHRLCREEGSRGGRRQRR
jgi:hypothetical protein